MKVPNDILLLIFPSKLTKTVEKTEEVLGFNFLEQLLLETTLKSPLFVRLPENISAEEPFMFSWRRIGINKIRRNSHWIE